MQWVTRRRPKIDRLATPWLIRRFIDKDAEFLFAAPDDVRRVANGTGAIPFDVPGVELAAPQGGCSFDAVVAKYQLKDAALERVAAVVRAADNDNGNVPEAAGLRAISFGLAGTIRDDQERVAQALILYDALYRWARKPVETFIRPERGLALWRARRRDRRALAEMAPHLLRDIALTAEEVQQEMARPFWR